MESPLDEKVLDAISESGEGKSSTYNDAHLPGIYIPLRFHLQARSTVKLTVSRYCTPRKDSTGRPSAMCDEAIGWLRLLVLEEGLLVC